MNDTTTEEEYDCENCERVVPESQGSNVMVHPQTWEEPAEYVFVCDACNGGEIEPDVDDYYYDDPALDYAYDPFSD